MAATALRSRRGRSATGAVLALTLSVTAAALTAGGAHATSTVATVAHAASKTPTKAALLHPKKKYFGVFESGLPSDIGRLKTIKSQTGKTPNLDMWFQAWNANANSGTSNFNASGARKACAAGTLPMMTWESWNTSGGAPYAQPAFSPKVVTSGRYDKYIRNVAKAMKAIHCPIELRFDQEQNGYWYPWGFRTTGMGSGKATPKNYVAMWRHVWNIFHAEHATNVIWVWSPNYITVKGQPKLQASYPGSKYVDEVGIDGYIKQGTATTFAKLFKSTIAQIEFARRKPWIVAETAVGSGPKKPQEIKGLVNSIAADKRFIGMIWFDYYNSSLRSNWLFEQTHQTLSAFRAAIGKKTWGSARAGSL